MGDFSTAFGLCPHFGRNDIIKPNEHNVISSVSREIPCIRTENCRTRLPQTLARAGSAPRGGSPPPLLSFRFREIPTVVSLPRNDKLYTRVRHFSRIIIINKAYVRTATVIARSATRDVAIALARRGGTKCRKNSPQVTVFSQSGEATCCERGGKTYLRTRTLYPFRGGFLHCVRTLSSLRSK